MMSIGWPNSGNDSTRATARSANSAIADSASSGETVAEGQAQMFPIGMLPNPEP